MWVCAPHVLSGWTDRRPVSNGPRIASLGACGPLIPSLSGPCLHVTGWTGIPKPDPDPPDPRPWHRWPQGCRGTTVSVGLSEPRGVQTRHPETLLRASLTGRLCLLRPYFALSGMRGNLAHFRIILTVIVMAGVCQVLLQCLPGRHRFLLEPLMGRASPSAPREAQLGSGGTGGSCGSSPECPVTAATSAFQGQLALALLTFSLGIWCVFCPG